MSTINDKIVAMMATIQEIRKLLAKNAKNAAPDKILEMVSLKGSANQSELLETVSGVSSRTVRRHLDMLVRTGRLGRRKEGREVIYYPQD